MSAPICPLEYAGCCVTLTDDTGTHTQCISNAPAAVPTLGEYGGLALVIIILAIGIAILWRHAAEQDAQRQKHGPQPRYPNHPSADFDDDLPGITPLNICQEDGKPCTCHAGYCAIRNLKERGK